MKQASIVTALAGCLIVLPAYAGSNSTVIEAPVVSAEPIVRLTTDRIPHKACRNERVKVVHANGNHSATPAILGAVIGGTAAASLGHNSYHQPLIAGVGALLGASIGHDVAHQRNARGHYVTEQRCVVNYELRDSEQIVGYRVGYRYGDTIYHTRTGTHPGPTIKVRLQLEPLS